jgi:hypothetical protein
MATKVQSKAAKVLEIQVRNTNKRSWSVPRESSMFASKCLVVEWAIKYDVIVKIYRERNIQVYEKKKN